MAGDKQKAFVRLLRGSPTKGSYHEDIHEFSAADFVASPAHYKLRAILLVSDLDQAVVQELFSASHDGERLLVSVHYCYRRQQNAASYRWHPHIFHARTGQVTAVQA